MLVVLEVEEHKSDDNEKSGVVPDWHESREREEGPREGKANGGFFDFEQDHAHESRGFSEQRTDGVPHSVYP